MRLLASCVILLGIAMIQAPGLLVADTKFDLATDPEGFLGRATHLWDAQGAFGQLQNQAYGYLVPMGSVFEVGSLLNLPGWAVQRLWLALVMVLALTGAVRLCRELGVRSDLACLVAGFAYALSPRMLTTLGPISIEALPSALAPWVVVPLVIGAERGSARRAAARSALAVAAVGGVNAAASFAVIPLGAIWILTRSPGARRRTLLLWWPAFTLLGTLWWLVPLFVMGAYSPPFLDYIEAAANTTFPTTLFDALRGTSNWVPYLDPGNRAGNDLLRLSFLIINSAVVLFFGLVGLMLPRNPHRLFLLLGLGLGLAMVTMGHLGSVSGWGAGGLQSLLDGALAPLRNVHKFDPLIRLPLVIGLAMTVEWLSGPRDRTLQRINAAILVGTCVVAVFGASLPATASRIPPAGGIEGVPDYWTEAADWLAETGGGEGTALLVPGSGFARYVWGFTRDEPMQWLAKSRWAVRNAVPLTPPDNIRMLDAIESRLAQGKGSFGLWQALRRSGVTHLVVRNDLTRTADLPDPLLVHQAIATTPGLTRVSTFGPTVGGQAHLAPGPDGRILVNDGWQDEYPTLEIFEVSGSTYARDTPLLPVVAGGPEDLLDLADFGLLQDQPTQLATDLRAAPDPEQPLILTDGLRAVERHFGRVHDGTSATRVPGEERRMPNRRLDYLDPGDEDWLTTARIDGVRALTASSSMSDANALGPVQRGQLPYAAIDGDQDTQWRSNLVQEQSWWQVDFEQPTMVDVIVLRGGPDQRQLVRLRTDAGVTEPIVLNPRISRTIAVPGGAASWLRVEDASGASSTRLAISEIRIPGVQAQRTLVLPSLPEGWPTPDAILLRAIGDARTGCVDVDGATRCALGRSIAAEEPVDVDRELTLPAATDYTPVLSVRPRPGTGLDKLLLNSQLADVEASSTAFDDPRASAHAAVDGDRGTTWIADPADLRPTLRLGWIGERQVTGLRLSVAADSAARLPEELTLTWAGNRRTVRVRADGEVRFAGIRTDQLTLRVEEAEPAVSLDFASVARPVPVGIGELRVRGVDDFPLLISKVRTQSRCGSGPTIEVEGEQIRTAVTASPSDLLAGATVPAQICGVTSVSLEAGANDVSVSASAAFVPVALALTDSSASIAGPVATPVAVSRTGPVRLSLDPANVAGVLVTAENTNPGWSARQESELEPVVIDGWQQGWRLDGSGEPVVVRFAPDSVYRMGLLLGLLALGILGAFCLVPARRWPASDAVPLGTARLPRVLGPLLAVAAGGLLASWMGVGVAVLAFVVALLVRRVAAEAAPWLLAGLILPAAGAYAARPWGSIDGWAGGLAWPHYLVVATFAAALALLPVAGWLPGSLAKRIAGSSTSR